jgi:hypothetical protein
LFVALFEALALLMINSVSFFVMAPLNLGQPPIFFGRAERVDPLEFRSLYFFMIRVVWS